MKGVVSIKFGYSDSEDRAWLILQSISAARAWFWINRKQIIELITSCLHHLESTFKPPRLSSSKAIQLSLQDEHAILNSISSLNLLKPRRLDSRVSEQTSTSKWLVLKHIQTKTNGETLSVKFFYASGNFSLNLSRRDVHGLLKLLRKLDNYSQWDLKKYFGWAQ